MATQSSKAGKQSRSADVERDAPASAPTEVTYADVPASEPTVVEATAAEATIAETPVTQAVAEPPVAEPAAPPAPVIEAFSAPLAVVEKVVETTGEAFAATFEFDGGLWSKKSFELWAENASAFLDLAEQIVKAQTFEEVVELQSRFANQRFEAFVRQSKELMELTQRLAALSAAPLCEVRSAA